MENPMNLSDRVIIVTGAAQGIGRGVALKAASLGARLALVDINGDGARETAELLGGKARDAVPCYDHIGGRTKDECVEGVKIRFCDDGKLSTFDCRDVGATSCGPTAAGVNCKF